MRKFGEFIAEKRKSRGITLRGMAGKLEISPAYLSDIEKSRRNPPDLTMLKKMAVELNLSQEDKYAMFDLRKASKKDATDDFWKEIIKKLDEE